MAKINKAKYWFFEKTNKRDKPLATLIKKRGGGRRIKSIKLEMKLEKSKQKTQKCKDCKRLLSATICQ